MLWHACLYSVSQHHLARFLEMPPIYDPRIVFLMVPFHRVYFKISLKRGQTHSNKFQGEQIQIQPTLIGKVNKGGGRGNQSQGGKSTPPPLKETSNNIL